MSRLTVLCVFVLCISASLIGIGNTQSSTTSNPFPSITGVCNKTNQEWHSCGTACPMRCGDTEPIPCTYQCLPHCECIHGTILRDDGECVLPEDC